MNKIKTGEITLDELLYPGRYLRDVPIENLKIEVMDSGWASFNRIMLLKKNRGEMIIVGGRPSHGKSAWLFQLAYQVSRKYRPHVFSLEMDCEQILTRLLAPILNRPIDAIQKGLVSIEDLKRAKADLDKFEYLIDDRAGISVEALCDAARVRHKKHGTDLIIIDYLQLLKVDKGHSRDSEVAEISRQLRALGKELRVPVLVASQLNRQCEYKDKAGKIRMPQLSDLRDSGALEQDADIVILVNRESRYTGNRVGEADLIVCKNRNGECKNIIMQFAPAQTAFYDMDEI